MKKLELENMRLKSAVKELAALNEISSVINSTMPLETISKKIMKNVVKAIGAAEAALHTFSDEENLLSPKTFVRGKLDSMAIDQAHLDINITGWIAKNKTSLLVNDLKKDHRFANIDFGDNPIKSLLTVPLIAKGRLIGALSVFNSNNPMGFSNDDVRLLSIIGTQSAQIIENSRLYQEELRLKQLEGEIQAARKIQEGFLPKNIPQMKYFDIFGNTRPARDVGGDYFDLIPVNSSQMFFSIGDVSGKGVPAALLMATIQGQFRLLVCRASDSSPDRILSQLNSIICQLSGSAQFATMIVGRLDENDDLIEICNGGHCYPIVVRKDGSIEEITESCLLIGAVEQVEYSSEVCRLDEGELFVVASDGIDEAMNPAGEDFGLDRFKEILLSNRHLPVQDIFNNVVEHVDRFRQGIEPSDDTTLLIIKRK